MVGWYGKARAALFTIAKHVTCASRIIATLIASPEHEVKGTIVEIEAAQLSEAAKVRLSICAHADDLCNIVIDYMIDLPSFRRAKIK